MPDSYLTLARVVLETRGQPMSAQQILDDAKRHGLLPNHLSGETMPKTLQARIAEDIFNNRSRSIFYRTSIGTYFLRSQSDDSSLPRRFRTEFTPSSRTRPLPKDRILWFEHEFQFPETRLLSKTETNSLAQIRSSYHFFEDEPPRAYRALTFSITSRNQRILKHTIGKYSNFSDLIGLQTIGLRRYVDEYDLDLFGDDKFGVDINSAREILRNILSSKISLDDRTIRNRISRLGAIIEPEYRRLSLIVHVDLTDLKGFSGNLTRRLEINDPSWASPELIGGSNTDQISNIVLQNLFKP